MFNIVKFPNDPCDSGGTKNGTCYTKSVLGISMSRTVPNPIILLGKNVITEVVRKTDLVPADMEFVALVSSCPFSN